MVGEGKLNNPNDMANVAAIRQQIQALQEAQSLFQQNAAQHLAALNDAVVELQGRLDKLSQPLPLPEFYVAPMKAAPDTIDRFLLSIENQTGSETDRLYLVHQAVLRGSKEQIAHRQSYYLPHLHIPPHHRELPVVDIGCGRGEFLELLREKDIKCVGVELNLAEVKKLQAQAFEVYVGDARDYLKEASDNSLAAITAFQVIEHLSYDYLRDFLKLAYAKLASGGKILLETVNPYCLSTWRTYYLDPTHEHPVPKDLLEILLRFYGFQRIQTFYQSPMASLGVSQVGDPSLHYQDYALMGQK